jgi:cell division protein FtsW
MIVLVGIIMVYSSSYIYSKEVIGSSTHFLFKQLFFLFLGGCIAFVLSKTKFSFWYENSYKLNIAANFLLMLTLTPLGLSIKGSNRWLNFGGLNLQPGEFVKYTVLLSAVYFFTNLKNYSRNDKILYSMHLIIPLGLLIIQPDFGTFSISAILIAFVCFLSDFPRKYFYSAVIVGAGSLFAILVAAPYRVKRLLTFLDPWADPQNSGFQIIQSYLAFANGHIFGQGIGNSNEKLFYLPEAYNDFIFSVLGEEIGLVGVFGVIALFAIFMYLGFKLALTNRGKINTIFVASIVFTIGFQAFLNMAVVLGLLPTKGLNLPFISYGGSSLMANLLAIGLMFCALTNKSQIIKRD